MAVETVDCNIEVVGNDLVIIPKTGISSNFYYNISIDSVKALNSGKTAENIDIDFVTALTPAYCSIDGVQELIDVFTLPELKIALYIYHASKYVDYILSQSQSGTVPYAVSEFSRHKAALDALVHAYMDLARNMGQKGTLADIGFENAPSIPGFKTIIEEMKEQVKFWEYSARGFAYEGRVRPWTTVKGIRQLSGNPNAPTWTQNYSADYGRGPNQ